MAALAAAVDSVLRFERALTERWPADAKYAFEYRNDQLLRQYAEGFTRAYDRMLDGMVERRMRAAVGAVASVWYTCWVDAGQPDLRSLVQAEPEEADRKAFEALDEAWRKNAIIGRRED